MGCRPAENPLFINCKTKYFQETGSNYNGDRSTNGEGIYELSAGDDIIVIASKSGNTATNSGDVEGDANGVRTILVVTKVWY